MKHFINLKDIPAKDLRKIIIDAKKRKSARKRLNHLEVDKGSPLKGKLLIQMFEKSSLRTRLSFYLAIKQLGGSTLTLRSDELHLSKGGESIEDTAKILSNFGNAFMLRTDSDKKLEEFKKHLSIPIINGLSPSSHATQILSDVFTVEEIKKKPISKLNITWVGDSNNVLNSLIAASIKFSFRLKIGCPKKYQPTKENLSKHPEYFFGDFGRISERYIDFYDFFLEKKNTTQCDKYWNCLHYCCGYSKRTKNNADYKEYRSK